MFVAEPSNGFFYEEPNCPALFAWFIEENTTYKTVPGSNTARPQLQSTVDETRTAADTTDMSFNVTFQTFHNHIQSELGKLSSLWEDMTIYSGYETFAK